MNPSPTSACSGAADTSLRLSPLKLRTVQVGIAQVGTVQVGTAQVGTAQVGTVQAGYTHVGTAQVGTAQVGSAQVDRNRWIVYSPRVPSSNSLFQEVDLVGIRHRTPCLSSRLWAVAPLV